LTSSAQSSDPPFVIAICMAWVFDAIDVPDPLADHVISGIIIVVVMMIAIDVVLYVVPDPMRERLEWIAAGAGFAIVSGGFTALCVYWLYDDIRWLIGIVRWLSP
jgi:hypothetical protein